MSAEIYDFDKISQQAWSDVQEVRAAWHQLLTAQNERHAQIAKQLSRSPIVGPLIGLMLNAIAHHHASNPPQVHLHADGSYFIGYQSPNARGVVAVGALHHDSPYELAEQLRKKFAERTLKHIPSLRISF